jgi:hypothetical protein
MNIKELTIVRIGLTDVEAYELGAWLEQNTSEGDSKIIDKLYSEFNDLGYIPEIPDPEEAD